MSEQDKNKEPSLAEQTRTVIEILEVRPYNVLLVKPNSVRINGKEVRVKAGTLRVEAGDSQKATEVHMTLLPDVVTISGRAEVPALPESDQ